MRPGDLITTFDLQKRLIFRTNHAPWQHCGELTPDGIALVIAVDGVGANMLLVLNSKAELGWIYESFTKTITVSTGDSNP